MVAQILGLQLHGSALSVPAVPRRRALAVLTRLQSASAAALAAFGAVHLSAPLVGLLHLGGDVNDRIDAVSRWMLLGRVAYQSGLGEAVLWASLAAHVAAGVAKRLVLRFTVVRSKPLDTAAEATEPTEEDTSAASQPPVATSQLSIAHKSGYVLAPFALHHAFVNRILPSSSAAPILGLSPSELDYSFVSHTLSHPNLRARLLMAGAYTILIGAFAVHVTYALPALLRSLSTSSTTGKRRTKGSRRCQAQVSTSLAVVLLASLAAIVPLRSSDRLTISGALKSRYDAVLRLAFPTRYLF